MTYIPSAQELKEARQAGIERDKREIIGRREQEWWQKHREAWLKQHPQARRAWLARHGSTRDMPMPAGAAPDLTPEGGFVVIEAQSGRGRFVIAADSFAKMPKRAQKKLLDYAEL